MHASAAVDGRELGAGTSAQLSLVRMLVWSCCSLPTALLLTALWRGEDPSGERRNPIFFRQYGFLYLGFVLMIRIKARNVNREECILWASLILCFFLRRWVKEKNSKEQSKSLWATWYLETLRICWPPFFFATELKESESFGDIWSLWERKWRGCSGSFKNSSGKQGTVLTSKSKLFIWVWMLCASSAGTPLKCLSFELPVSLITMANGTIHLTHFSISHHWYPAMKIHVRLKWGQQLVYKFNTPMNGLESQRTWNLLHQFRWREMIQGRSSKYPIRKF